MPNRSRFTVGEIDAMRDASARGHTAWDRNVRLDSVKRKIKEFRIIRSSQTCCYCRRDIGGEFSMVLDVEHVLPKSQYLKYMFSGKNLAVSCKRCNMSIKGARLDFLFSPVMPKRVFRSKYYKIIHPNLDDYESHLLRNAVQIGASVLVKYSVVGRSSKGYYTYEFFKLDALERNSFDKAQGASGRSELKDREVKAAFEMLLHALVS